VERVWWTGSSPFQPHPSFFFASNRQSSLLQPKRPEDGRERVLAVWIFGRIYFLRLQAKVLARMGVLHRKNRSSTKTKHKPPTMVFVFFLLNRFTIGAASDSLSFLSTSFPESIFESDTLLEMKCLFFSFIGLVFIYDEVLHYIGNILSFKRRFIYFPSESTIPLKKMESQFSYPPACGRDKKMRGFSYPFKGVMKKGKELRGSG
jgi:hypothetical protein